MKRFNLICIFFIWILGSSAQGFKVQDSLPGYGIHLTKAIFEISPGNYIGAGIMVDTLTGADHLCIMGLGNQGQLLWTKKYGNDKFQYLDNQFISRSFYKQGSSIYYAGCVLDSNNKFIGVLIKFNQAGDTLWQKIYRDSVEIVPQMVTGSVDGGFLITGLIERSTSQPCLLLKTDINGNELWRKEIQKTTVPSTHDGKAIMQDSASKNIVIIGYQYIGNASSWDSFDNILILDSLGNKISQQHFGYGGQLLDLIQTKDKKFVAVGQSTSTQSIGNLAEYTSYIVKFDISNPTSYVWKNVYFDKVTTWNLFNTIVELKNGNLLVGGNIDTASVPTLTPNILTRFVIMDATNGSLMWDRYYNYNNTPGSSNYQGITDFHSASDKGWIAAIEITGSSNNGNHPFFFVKYDSTGCDSSLAYCQMYEVGIAKNYLNETTVRLYPNPNNGELHISIDGSDQNKQMILNIADISGRIVKNIKLQGSTDEHVVNVKDLVVGVYLISVSRDERTVYTGKLIKEN